MSLLREPTRPRVRLFVWLGYWVFLFVIMHTLGVGTGLPRLHHSDKVGHFLFYALLTTLGAWRLSTPNTRAGTVLLWTWAAVYIAYGALDEYLQQFVGRDMDFYDWLADVAGVTVATLLIALRRRRLSEPGSAV